MKYKKIIVKNHAVAGVIEALLMVALVSIIISMIQLIYIPQIMEQREADHMDEVSNQFSYLKSMIDIQVMTESDVPLFSMLTLSSDKLPYFITAPSSGWASIDDTNLASITLGASAHFCDITSIKYEAHNSYFVDQTYSLEGSGIFLKQPTGETVRVYPSIFAVENETNPDKIDIHFDLFPKFIGLKGKNSSGNKGKCYIRTSYSDPPNYNYLKDLDITEGFFRIHTDYPIAWKKSLENTTEGLVDIILDPSDSPTYVEVRPPVGKDIGLYIKEFEINVQIGHGWIK